MEFTVHTGCIAIIVRKKTDPSPIDINVSIQSEMYYLDTQQSQSTARLQTSGLRVSWHAVMYSVIPTLRCHAPEIFHLCHEIVMNPFAWIIPEAVTTLEINREGIVKCPLEVIAGIFSK